MNFLQVCSLKIECTLSVERKERETSCKKGNAAKRTNTIRTHGSYSSVLCRGAAELIRRVAKRYKNQVKKGNDRRRLPVHSRSAISSAAHSSRCWSEDISGLGEGNFSTLMGCPSRATTSLLFENCLEMELCSKKWLLTRTNLF